MVVGLEKRNMSISLPTDRNVTPSSGDRGADEERARRLAGGLHADALGALDPPVADSVEVEHVTLPRRSREVLLVERPAAVREDELEAVADQVARRPRSLRLAQERCVALEGRERAGAPLALDVALDCVEGQAPRRERPLEGSEILLREIVTHAYCHQANRTTSPPPPG